MRSGWVISLFLAAALSLWGEMLKEGSLLPAMELTKADGKTVVIPGETRLLLLAFDKAMGKSADRVLRGNGGLLKSSRTVYITDISAVPGFVWTMFMAPAFEKYDYPIALLRDEETALRFPRKEDHLTLLHLLEGTITKIEFLSGEEALREALSKE